MNFEKFEDRNWFQLIRNRVIRISDGSIIKQDFLSTLLLINVITYIIESMKFFWDTGINKLFLSFISILFSFIFTFNSFFDFFLGKVVEPIFGNRLLFLS